MFNPALLALAASQTKSTDTAKQALLAKLTKAKAFDVSNAIRLGDAPAEAAALTELVGQSIVRPKGDGRYYLDRERQRERVVQQGWLAPAVLLGVANVTVSLIAIAASR